jgi:hypothetical protein
MSDASEKILRWTIFVVMIAPLAGFLILMAISGLIRLIGCFWSLP